MVGFDIGGTKCAVSIGEEKGGKLEIRAKKAIPTDLTISPFYHYLCSEVEKHFFK